MRAKLAPGEQQRFINDVLQLTGWTLKELGERCGVGKTAIIYWRSERNRIPHAQLERMAALANLPLPEIEALIDDNERRRKGGRVSQQRRHDEPECYPALQTLQKDIARPDHSPALAEFIGIMLGDGGISQHQVSITSNIHHEREYAGFVADLAQNLFSVEAAIWERPDHGAITLVLSSIKLVRYLLELGLVKGNKVTQQCAIPDWIFTDIEFMRACVRGLMDTDGCVYHHGYQIKGKEYSYVKMTFASRSWPLMEGVQRIWQALGFRAGSVRDRGYISLSSSNDVRRYYEQVVGTNNPYHWGRYRESLERIKKRQEQS